MKGKISIGELRQNPTQMLRDVKAGATYVITDHGEPVADVSAHEAHRWVTSEEVNELLAELKPDPQWAEDVADVREVEEPNDPWGDDE